MRIRLREPAGQTTLTLADEATVEELQSQIREKTAIPAFDVKYGYPPKPLILEGYEKAAKLSEIGVKLDGEQLIVSRSHAIPSESAQLPDNSASPPNSPTTNGPSSNKTSTYKSISQSTASSFSFADVGTAPPTPPVPASTIGTSSQGIARKPLSLARRPSAMDQDTPEFPLPTHGSTVVLRIMPDDNSCLFRAFNTAFFGAMDNMTELRSIIAQNIQANPETYSAVVLEQAPDDYCRWIQSENAWGGAIELDILSKHFDIEICSIDVQALRTDRYNEGRPQRCILVYSGVHYDTIALSPSDPPHTEADAPPEFDTKIFDALDNGVLESAVELCRVLQRRHYYTDTTGFSVRCHECGQLLKGERGAIKHAEETGHIDFGENV